MLKDIICLKVLQVIQLIEWLGTRWPAFGDWYRRVFYDKMIRSEAEKCSLRPGMKVLHIGSGPLPMTSISLSLIGFSVVAVDFDLTAIKEAKERVKELGLTKRIKFVQADGADISSQGFDAVWISLHVQTKEKVLNKVYSDLKPGGKIVFRNSRDWLSLIYPQVDTEQAFPQMDYISLKQKIGKESIVLKKPSLAVNSKLPAAN